MTDNINHIPNLGQRNISAKQNHPNHWFNRAADLHASAGGLWWVMHQQNEADVSRDLGFPPGHSMSVACRPVFHMLCGLSLEVIMKAVLVQRDVAFNKSHRLNTLVSLLGLSKSKQELALLKFYEESILWAGRYPIPLKASDEKLREFWSLASNVLTSEINLGKEYKLSVRQRNNADSWEKFDHCWRQYAALFKH